MQVEAGAVLSHIYSLSQACSMSANGLRVEFAVVRRCWMVGNRVKRRPSCFGRCAWRISGGGSSKYALGRARLRYVCSKPRRIAHGTRRWRGNHCWNHRCWDYGWNPREPLLGPRLGPCLWNPARTADMEKLRGYEGEGTGITLQALGVATFGPDCRVVEHNHGGGL